MCKLEGRLNKYNSMGSKLDSRLSNAFEILCAIRDKTAEEIRYRDGWKGAEHVVTLLEQQYHTAISKGASLSTKMKESLHFLEHKLHELESSAVTQWEKIEPLRRKLDVQKVKFEGYVEGQLQAGADGLDRMAKACKAGALRLLTYDELPHVYQNNQFITGGYRFYENTWDCLFSILHIHNETFNIWTHLVGFVFMLVMGLYYYPLTQSFAMSSFADPIVFGIFLVAALKCLLLSSTWHVFSCFAKVPVFKTCACMDYVGISVLIAASIISTEYYGFDGKIFAQVFYMTLTAVLGCIGIVIPWFEWFDTVENRGWRITFFLGIAVSGIIPMLHLSYITSLKQALFFLAPISKSLFSYIAGVVIYGSQIPERWMPGKFNHFGASHQLWHICILMGIYYHYEYIMQMCLSKGTWPFIEISDWRDISWHGYLHLLEISK
jgi:adiponectin receptor